MKRLPSLNAIRAFRKVAEVGGISKAATQLHVSQSAVSRFISLLEDELGVELFNRKGGFTLTSAGQTLFEHVTKSFQILEEGVVLLGRQHLSDLNVKTNPSFALRWLLHQKDLPQGVSITPRWKSISVTEEEFNVGIRWGLGDWPERYAVPLYEEQLIPVCTTAYMAQHGPFNSASDLLRAALIHPDPTYHDWRAWTKCWSGGEFPIERGMTFDTLDHALQGAKAGHGIAMADHFLVQQELATGELVPAVSEIHPSGVSYYLVFRQKLAEDMRLKALVIWLQQKLVGAGAARPVG